MRTDVRTTDNGLIKEVRKLFGLRISVNGPLKYSTLVGESISFLFRNLRMIFETETLKINL